MSKTSRAVFLLLSIAFAIAGFWCFLAMGRGLFLGIYGVISWVFCGSCYRVWDKAREATTLVRPM